MEYIVKIRWAWGLKETKSFKTDDDREDFLERCEENEDIDYCVIENSEQNGIMAMLSDIENTIYDPTSDMSDHEMDVYL